MESLKLWLRLADRRQKSAFFNKVGSSSSYLSQIINGHANASVTMAGSIEKATSELGNDRMPTVDRGQICSVCTECPFYIKCKEDVQ